MNNDSENNNKEQINKAHCNCEENNCHCEDDSCHCDKECNCDNKQKNKNKEQFTKDENQKENQKNESEINQDILQEVIDYKSLYQQTMAEFDNFRKRTVTIISDSKTDGIVEAVKAILPSLDSFEQAAKMIVDKNVLIGVEYIEKNIMNALTTLGVTKIDATGMFNPELHFAVSTDSESDAPAGTIVKELSSGYKLGEKVIRYSQVMVKK